MTATARTATQVRGSVGTPVITVVPPPVEYRAPEQWDREYLLDVAAASSRDAYDLCGHSELVRAICDDYGIVAGDVNMLRTQRDGARQKVEKLGAVIKHNLKLEDDIAAERNKHQVTMLEREAARADLEETQALLLAESAEVVRLQALAAKLSAQLAETSRRLIDVSFDHAALVIKQLGGEDVRGQSMVFDTTADTTVVDVEMP